MVGKFLGNVRWKSSYNNTSWNISVAFLESCLSISEENECLTSVNMKTNTALKTEKKMNQKPYNKCLINLAYSVCTGKYLPSVFSHRPRSFVARSVRKPQANTFPYRPRTRLI